MGTQRHPNQEWGSAHSAGKKNKKTQWILPRPSVLFARLSPAVKMPNLRHALLRLEPTPLSMIPTRIVKSEMWNFGVKNDLTKEKRLHSFGFKDLSLDGKCCPAIHHQATGGWLCLCQSKLKADLDKEMLFHHFCRTCSCLLPVKATEPKRKFRLRSSPSQTTAAPGVPELEVKPRGP